jgi:class 3 adenylate cyclase/tetratricopeptide (TPR) repeat protein
MVLGSRSVAARRNGTVTKVSAHSETIGWVHAFDSEKQPLAKLLYAFFDRAYAQPMLACPACGFEYLGEFRFCPECAAPLGTAARPLPEERKVVTSLFCDLVGFTAASESADPEDVDRMLAAYFAMARSGIESYGGVVEKFIGDAVVGVFGVPAIHEDDPERAVRAAFQIIEGAERLHGIGGERLLVRIGINTGEALVRLGIAPSSGEGFVTGDPVNTAARLQSIAPPMGVVVGLPTYEATYKHFDYDELDAATLKGKSEPVRVFLAKALAPPGPDLISTRASALIGREPELSILKDAFNATVASISTKLVTVVGEPGIGKTRILAELLHLIEQQSEVITWRQGRCLPYGDGVTFWALGEVVKAHAGILESDDLATVNTKLAKAVPEGPDREWMRQRLLPLLGLEASSVAEREELFTAWGRFCKHIANRGPTILVFEDLHWADDAMLAFLEHLADRVRDVPLLVVGTTRPDLFERNPGFASERRNVDFINLVPLTDKETATLVSALLDTALIPKELERPIVERSGGNPLFTEEFVRLLKDRELLVREGKTWKLIDGAEVPFPDSVQALIAARLDMLPPDQKALLADAAVVGKTFWVGAVVRMGERDPAEVFGALRDLARKEFVRPARVSSMEGDTEYAFWHVLARDVAYAQLPRASRADKHVAAAGWIEARAGMRVEDLSEVLAHHYATALELARATGEKEQAASLESSALRFLMLAGERALGLDTATAFADFRRAVALVPPGHPKRPEVLVLLAEGARQSGRPKDAAEALEEAIVAFRERGDIATAARSMVALSDVLRHLSDQRGYELPAEALALLESLPPGPELVEVLTDMAATKSRGAAYAEELAWADRALDLANQLGMEVPANALGLRGVSRRYLGDSGGLRDIREALELAISRGHGREAAVLYNQLGATLSDFEGPAKAMATWREGVAFAERRGIAEQALRMELNIGVLALVETGSLDEAIETLERTSARFEALGDVDSVGEVSSYQLEILLLRGEAGAEALRRSAERLDHAIEVIAPETGDLDSLVYLLYEAAITCAALSENDLTVAHLNRIAATPNVGISEFYPPCLPRLVRTALACDDPELAERLVREAVVYSPYAKHATAAAGAAISEARGHHQAAADAYSDAAARWEEFGHVLERAFALLGEGRSLLALSRRTVADRALRQARDLFASLGAGPALTETDALLTQARPGS